MYGRIERAGRRQRNRSLTLMTVVVPCVQRLLHGIVPGVSLLATDLTSKGLTYRLANDLVEL